MPRMVMCRVFLSIQAQDFIEENCQHAFVTASCKFLSIQAQDFIEDIKPRGEGGGGGEYS